MSRLFMESWGHRSVETADLGSSDATIETSILPGYWASARLKVNPASGYWWRSIASSSEIYLGTRLRFPVAELTGLIEFRTADGTLQDRLVKDLGGHLQAWRGDGTVLASGTKVLAVNKEYWIEIHLKPLDSGGAFDVRIDGVSEFTFSGDTKYHASQANIDSIKLVSGGNAHYFADLIVNDTAGTRCNSWPGDRAVYWIPLNAAGDVTQLTRFGTDSGANWSQSEEVPPNDADGVGSSTVDQYDLYNLAASLSELTDVDAIAIVIRAYKNDAGAASIAAMLKSGGTENQDADRALSTTAAYYTEIHEIDPTDSAAWTNTKLDALQVGVKAR